MIVRYIIHHAYLVDLLFLLVVPVIFIFLGFFVNCRHKARTSHSTSNRTHRFPLASKLLIIAGLLISALYAYGRYVGTRQLEVRQVELSFSDLPEAFDGLRVVHVSDFHLGSLPDGMLRSVIDSINAQKPDLIAITGDMMNCASTEVKEQLPELKRLKAPAEGIFFVVGNHDDGTYEFEDPMWADADEGRLVSMLLDMKWRVLINGHRTLRRPDGSRLVVTGLDNDGEPPFKAKADLGQALYRVRRHDFLLVLEHDPTCWRRKILPHCHAQLTLSGHTHGGQLSLFGLSPAALRYREHQGLYTVGERSLYVSKGIGGALPFRLGATPEIVVLTLKKKK